MILRPYGVIIDGVLELGLEIVLGQGVIQEVRPHTGVPDLFVVSPAFINAHSHLEYRGLQGVINEPEYAGWIREITRLKKEQSCERVRADCRLAAEENVQTGVAAIYEHSDRPFAGEAMAACGLKGLIAQEVITFHEAEAPDEKVRTVEKNARQNREAFDGPVFLNPHAYQTVDRKTLKWLGEQGTPLSIHVAETAYENQLTHSGEGPIADFYRANGIRVPATGKSVLASLDELGVVRENTQLVHCCALEEDDFALVMERRVSVAHCPRSNARLKSPPAKVRRLLDNGVAVALGLDSAASSGPIDMFAEMRSAMETSLSIGEPLTAERVWQMATTGGAETLRRAGLDLGSWRVEPRSSVPLIKINVEGAFSTADLLVAAQPKLTEPMLDARS